jgi:hypothetical protein
LVLSEKFIYVIGDGSSTIKLFLIIARFLYKSKSLSVLNSVAKSPENINSENVLLSKCGASFWPLDLKSAKVLPIFEIVNELYQLVNISQKWLWMPNL